MEVPKFFKRMQLKAPEITYFNHLVGEFESLALQNSRPALASPPAAELIVPPCPASATVQRLIAEIGKKVEALKLKRDQETIDWNDLYLLEMLLAEVRPVGELRSKVLSLRRDFRSVAGQVEYDEYLASKPKNLLDPPDPRNPPEKDADYEGLLRDDLKDVLGRLFKRYAILPVREARLKRLTIYASLFCGFFLLILVVAILSMGDWKSLPSIPLFVVLVCGAMGGFVSALQRIQSSPSEGDSVYNLALLYHGSYAVFVAPLTGAIFGILLYMMFAGETFKGPFFPEIVNPPANAKTAVTGKGQTDFTAKTKAKAKAGLSTGTFLAASSDLTSDLATVSDLTTGDDLTTEKDVTATKNPPTKTGADTESIGKTPPGSHALYAFLYRSGPKGGADYALLIIWSFIAGFAERFVPDSLNRLISDKSK